MADYIYRLDDVGMEDLARVGGKNASLGELRRSLAGEGIHVPDGFAIGVDAYRELIGTSGRDLEIRHLLDAYHTSKMTLADAGAALRMVIAEIPFPPALSLAIRHAYRALAKAVSKADPPVAVRSSATAEDLPEASFAGQQESYLNVVGEDQLLMACRRCYASLFTDRAIAYREAHEIDDITVALSIGVQEMVRSDLGTSGVMFSVDPDSGFPKVVVINSSFGLGEAVVQGAVDPDRYTVFKPLVADRKAVPIIEKRLGAKELKAVLAPGDSGTQMVETSTGERESWSLSDEDCLQLTRWAILVEEHYGRAMDMEWAKDGKSGSLYLVQARPATAQPEIGRLVQYRVPQQRTKLISGQAVGTSVAAGKVSIIREISQIDHFEDGNILVTERTDPDWTPVIKRAAAVVAEHGGTTSHAAIISRELGIPAVVGAQGATTILKDGAEATVSCAEGQLGIVYAGLLKFTREEIDPRSLPTTRTALMVNLADPDQTFRFWQLPAKGVGLARMEFIISNLLRIHPMAIAHPERLSGDDRKRMDELTSSYGSPSDYFVEKLASGLTKLAAPYHPDVAIVRLSDFKTNEYARLIGGSMFELPEENPMLGFRGASRYYDERYRDGFALECKAVKRAREIAGFTNIAVMVPFCRTTSEADRVLAVLAEEGLRRAEAGLKIYMMCEVPSNVILARDFAKRFDGFSIGSNDLTQLILGVDRDSDILAGLFDERNLAVTRSIAAVIRDAHDCGISIGICGEAPSNNPEFAHFLVDCKIDSMSLNPDSFVRTLLNVAAAEHAKGSSGRAASAPRAVPAMAS